MILVVLVVVLKTYDTFPSVKLVRMMVYPVIHEESVGESQDKITELSDRGISSGPSGTDGASAKRKCWTTSYSKT